MDNFPTGQSHIGLDEESRDEKEPEDDMDDDSAEEII